MLVRHLTSLQRPLDFPLFLVFPLSIKKNKNLSLFWYQLMCETRHLMDHLIQSRITHKFRLDSRRFDWILGEKVLVSNPDSSLHRSVHDLFMCFHEEVGDSKLHLFTSVCVFLSCWTIMWISLSGDSFMKWGHFVQSLRFQTFGFWKSVPSVNRSEGDMF